jgi:hypothetical protein
MRATQRVPRWLPDAPDVEITLHTRKPLFLTCVNRSRQLIVKNWPDLHQNVKSPVALATDKSATETGDISRRKTSARMANEKADD